MVVDVVAAIGVLAAPDAGVIVSCFDTTEATASMLGAVDSVAIISCFSEESTADTLFDSIASILDAIEECNDT